MVMKFWAVLRDAAGELVDAGELRGGREGGARRKGRMLWDGVVLSQARRGVYIGSRGGRRGMAGMVAMSSTAWLQGVLGRTVMSRRCVGVRGS
jgi:hypothetical protein